MQQAASLDPNYHHFERSFDILMEISLAAIEEERLPFMARLLGYACIDPVEGGEEVRHHTLSMPARNLRVKEGDPVDSFHFAMVPGDEEGQAEFSCMFAQADDVTATTDEPTSRFEATFDIGQIAMAPDGKLLLYPQDIIGTTTLPDGTEIEISFMEWFNACLYIAAAKPVRLKPNMLARQVQDQQRQLATAIL
ncbi:MAG: hypothetical protein AB7G06_07665 [Bdellovibrionales bacterium]